jgi:DNA-binding XRE family transcriptional regulator
MLFSLNIIIFTCLLLLLIALPIVLIIIALFKYIRTKNSTPQKTVLSAKSLGEAIKFYRTKCGMTQEFVAEALNVSRQAVSKWETDASDPSTANLIALAKLFNISPEELLKTIL